MAKRSKAIAYVLVYVFFAVYLFSINSILLKIDPEDDLKKVLLDTYGGEAEVFSILDSCDYVGGLMEYVYFEGWAYCLTEMENPNKTISLIFQSEKDKNKCYAIDAKAQSRPDVYSAFRGTTQEPLNQWNGVECKFSTIDMKNGRYCFYVAVKENDVDYGIKDTGYVFEKTNNSFLRVE